MLLIAGAVLAMGPAIHARAAAAAHDPGLYVSKGDTLTKIKSVMISDVRQKGIGKSILTQGFSKPTMEGHVPGGQASLRLPSGDVSFVAYLDPNADAKAQQMSIADAMNHAMGGGSGDGMPGTVKTGKDLGLSHLRQDGDERICPIKTNGSLVEGVEFVVEKIGTNDYKLTLKAPLAPGEYAFVVPKLAGGGQYWDFGVGGSK
jgi:hypothetical protein